MRRKEHKIDYGRHGHLETVSLVSHRPNCLSSTDHVSRAIAERNQGLTQMFWKNVGFLNPESWRKKRKLAIF